MAGPINDAELLQQTDYRIADGPGVDVPVFDMDAFLAQQDLGSVGEPVGEAGVADPGEAYRRAVMEEAGLIGPNLMGNAASAVGQAQAGQQAQAAPGQAPMAPGQSQRQGYGASVERQGYNSAAAERIAQGPAAKGLAAQRKAIDKQFVDTVNRGAAEIDNSVNNQIYGAQQALEAQAQALETRAGDVAAAQKSARDTVRTTFGVEIPEGLTGEAFAAAVGQAQTAFTQSAIQSMEADLGKARANMEAQLQVVKGMRVDPHRLARKGEFQWANAIAGIAAVSGKPGNMALANQLTNTFKDAAARDIEAQIANIQNQQNVSDGFMQVWNAVARDSSTIFEAKQKMMAGVAATVGSYLEGEAMKAQSEVERARIFSIAAEIEKWGVEAKQKWEVEANQIRTQRLGQELSHAASMAQVAVQRDRLAFDREQAQAQAQAQARAQQEQRQLQAANSVALNPFRGVQGMWKGETDAARDKNAREGNEKIAAATTLLQTLEKIERLQSVRGVDDAAYQALGGDTELNARLRVLTNMAASETVKVAELSPVSDLDYAVQSVAAGTEGAMTELLNAYYGADAGIKAVAEAAQLIDARLTNSLAQHTRPLIGNEARDVASVYGENVLGGFVVPVPTGAGTINVQGYSAPGMQRDWMNSDKQFSPQMADRAKAITDPRPQRAGERLHATAVSDYTQNAGWVSEKEAPPVWNEYTKSGPGSASVYGNTEARRANRSIPGISGVQLPAELARGTEVYTPEWATPTIALARAAAGGDKDALLGLTDIATSEEYRRGGTHKLEQAKFAEYLLTSLDSLDPHANNYVKPYMME